MDLEEAAILGIVLVMLIPCRKYFYRKASLLGERFTAGWIASDGIVLLGSLWLTFFSFKHVQYAGDMWWTFAFSENAPRSLRAIAGAVIACLFIALARLLRPASPRSPAAPTPTEWEKVSSLVALSRNTSANLALLGDKLFLFGKSGMSFIMYGTAGRNWVAMGDPVGEEGDRGELVWQFREMCDLYGWWPVFYKIGKETIPLAPLAPSIPSTSGTIPSASCARMMPFLRSATSGRGAGGAKAQGKEDCVHFRGEGGRKPLPQS
jgi:phosphatidylglycerol lysyltransferase